MDFRVLGHLEVREGGRVLTIGGGRQVALLAALLVRAGTVVRTDQLVEWLWGPDAEKVSANTLQALVSRLRKALGPDRLVNQADGYRLVVAPEELDSERFARQCAAANGLLENGDAARAGAQLTEALQLWRGRPYADVADEDFVRAEVVRLEELHVSARESRAEAELVLGRHASIVSELEALVTEHPLRERPRAQLMLALYRSGRQADALRVHRETRAVLVGELGIEPGAAVQELGQQILRQDPTLAWRAPSPPPPPAAPQEEPPPPQQRGPRRALPAAAIALALVVTGLAGVWTRQRAGDPELTPDSVVRIDRAGGTHEPIAVGARPGAIAFVGDELWVANESDGTVSHIDIAAKRVRRTLSLGRSVTGLAAGARSVWALSGDGGVFSLDTKYDTVIPIAHVPLLGLWGPQGGPGPRVAVEDDRVWVVDPAGQLVQLGPTGRAARTVDVGAGANGVAVSRGTAWVSNGWDGTVSRVDPTGTVVTVPAGHAPSGVAIGSSSIWVSLSLDDTVVRLSPEDGSVVATIPVGSHPGAIAVVGDRVWVSNAGDGTLSRIDARSNRVDRVLRLHAVAAGLAPHGDDLWVSLAPLAKPSPSVGGGVAHVALQNDIDSVDPALAYSHGSWEIEYATCAKLLNYPDSPGTAGSQLVPEVAESVPVPTDGGRTYRFTVRPGFRFAQPSGAPVTAAVFAHSVERTLKMSPIAADYLAQVVGVGDFVQGRAEHVTGITVAGAELTLRLVAPVGDLLTKLATPFFCAVPMETPVSPRGIGPIPSAGPYTIAAYVPGQRLVLTRNRYYQGDRPHVLDEIDYRIGVAPKRSEADAIAGRVDYVADGLSLAAYTDLARRYGPGSPAARAGHQQYFSNPHTGVRYLALNTNRPTFRDPSVRRAVAYAIDRTALAEQQQLYFSAENLAGGPPTDSLLPATMTQPNGAPGYPLRPDVATARQLMAGRRLNAVMYTCTRPPCAQIARILTDNLGVIGIRLEVRTMPKPALFARAQRPGEPYDLTLFGWNSDFPDPAAVLRPLVDGTYIDSKAGFNLARYDDATVNSRLAAAGRLTGPRRLRAFQQLATSIAEEQVPIIAYEQDTIRTFFSARTGCQVFHPVYFVDLAALCIRR